MMQSRFLLAGLGLLTASSAAIANDLEGVWARGDGKARVKVERCGDNFCATNIWVRPGTPLERVGDQLVMDIDPVAPTRFEGRAKDVRRGMTYSMSITLGGETMRTRGCVLGKLICKSADWASVN
ncbi:DUF2147 domain-containing protein [Martelella limonii]|uniref:DUF2147 domain-containing protein n=1 Tax=Martelella limonii TaxID=1647649 RepID=UPI001FCE561E|nr:DUF2147 domain-containing protein [Martelella limonii]